MSDSESPPEPICDYPSVTRKLQNTKGYKSMTFYDTTRYTPEQIAKRRNNYVLSYSSRNVETKSQKYVRLVSKRAKGGKSYAYQNQLGSDPNTQNLPIVNGSLILPGRSIDSTYYNEDVPLIGVKIRKDMQ
tara:strand:+ start:1081 stop:1473 length:393 start_codon:yes stop_codon:yes gene_type:complete